MIKNVSKVTEFSHKGVKYVVVGFDYDDAYWFGTVDKKYITNGRLNQTITLLHLCHKPTCSEAEQARIKAVDDYDITLEMAAKLGIKL